MKPLLLALALSVGLLTASPTLAQNEQGFQVGDTRPIRAFCAKIEEYLEMVAVHKQQGMQAAQAKWREKIMDLNSTCYLFPGMMVATVTLLNQLYIFDLPKDNVRLRLWQFKAEDGRFKDFLQKEFQTDIGFYMSWEKIDKEVGTDA